MTLVESGHLGVEKRGNPELGGPIEVLVNCNEVSAHKINEILKKLVPNMADHDDHCPVGVCAGS